MVRPLLEAADSEMEAWMICFISAKKNAEKFNYFSLVAFWQRQLAKTWSRHRCNDTCIYFNHSLLITHLQVEVLSIHLLRADAPVVAKCQSIRRSVERSGNYVHDVMGLTEKREGKGLPLEVPRPNSIVLNFHAILSIVRGSLSLSLEVSGLDLVLFFGGARFVVFLFGRDLLAFALAKVLVVALR